MECRAEYKIREIRFTLKRTLSLSLSLPFIPLSPAGAGKRRFTSSPWLRFIIFCRLPAANIPAESERAGGRKKGREREREREGDGVIWHTLISRRKIREIRLPLGHDSQSTPGTERWKIEKPDY